MIERYALVRGRIQQEIENLERVIEKVEKGMEKAHTGSEDADLLLDSVALNLHDFYSGLERVFQYIASHVDRHVPTGGEWHRELLNQMSLEVTGIRPAVLSNEIINSWTFAKIE